MRVATFVGACQRALRQQNAAMKNLIAATILATGAAMAHGFTVDLRHYRYYLQTPNMPVLVIGTGACGATNVKKGEWARGATLHTHPLTGEQFETPGCWRLTPDGADYCMVDEASKTIRGGCAPFEPKLLLDAAKLPRRGGF